MKAMLINKDANGYRSEITETDDATLPAGDVTVAVDYSGLNYKDSLALTGRGPIVKQFPMVPGVDFAGTVEHSTHVDFKPGDKVILTGWGVGEKHWGGFAEKARVKGDWPIPLPSAFSSRQAMAIGSAGYTAMLCADALARQGVTPDKGEIAISGATGGVGSFAVFLMAQRGYRVIAITGKTRETDYLRALGAADIIDRHSLPERARPLEKERWAGAIDTVGGNLLAILCAQMKYNGVVTACGLAGGSDLPTTVMPFILRGVILHGIDSVYTPKPERLKVWDRLAKEVGGEQIEAMSQTLPMSTIIPVAHEQLDGKRRGRIVVDVKR